MPEIKFTQFIFPHGRQEEITFQASEAGWRAWVELTEQGLRCTAEMRNSAVSLCIEDRERGDFQQVIVLNGPRVPKAVEELLSRWSLRDYRDFCAAYDFLNAPDFPVETMGHDEARKKINPRENIHGE